MMKHIIFAILVIHPTLGKKGGKGPSRHLDLTDVVNPDPDATEPAQSAEYNPELFEGDVFSGSNDKSDDRNAVADKTKLWPEAIVPYVLDSSVSDTLTQKILDAIADYHKHTCVKIVPRVNERDFVEFTSNNGEDYTYGGCMATSAGKEQGKLTINLQEPGCEKKGTIIHEILHALGFNHEQNRYDRDKYVKIVWDNLMSGQNIKDQFEKLAKADEDNLKMDYDYSSVMHYSERAFGSGRRTIKTLDRTKQKKIGQRAGFSKQDIKEVNKLYKCSGKKSGITGDIVRKSCPDTSSDPCYKWTRLLGKKFCSGPQGKNCKDTCGTCE